MIVNRLQHIGQGTLDGIARLGRANAFLMQVLAGMTGMLLRPSLLIKQLFSVGVQTLIIIIVAGLFVGMVMALQSYYYCYCYYYTTTTATPTTAVTRLM